MHALLYKCMTKRMAEVSDDLHEDDITEYSAHNFAALNKEINEGTTVRSYLFCCCPAGHVYPVEKLENVEDLNFALGCGYDTQFHGRRPKHPKKPCGKRVWEPVSCNKHKKRTPMMPFLVFSIEDQLKILLNRFNRITTWKSFLNTMDANHNPHVYSEVYHGAAFRALQADPRTTNKHDEDAILNISVQIGHDFAQKWGWTQNDMGPLQLVLMNLPRAKRFRPSNT